MVSKPKRKFQNAALYVLIFIVGGLPKVVLAEAPPNSGFKPSDDRHKVDLRNLPTIKATESGKLETTVPNPVSPDPTAQQESADAKKIVDQGNDSSQKQRETLLPNLNTAAKLLELNPTNKENRAAYEAVQGEVANQHLDFLEKTKRVPKKERNKVLSIMSQGIYQLGTGAAAAGDSTESSASPAVSSPRRNVRAALSGGAGQSGEGDGSDPVLLPEPLMAKDSLKLTNAESSAYKSTGKFIPFGGASLKDEEPATPKQQVADKLESAIEATDQIGMLAGAEAKAKPAADGEVTSESLGPTESALLLVAASRGLASEVPQKPATPEKIKGLVQKALGKDKGQSLFSKWEASAKGNSDALIRSFGEWRDSELKSYLASQTSIDPQVREAMTELMALDVANKLQDKGLLASRLTGVPNRSPLTLLALFAGAAALFTLFKPRKKRSAAKRPASTYVIKDKPEPKWATAIKGKMEPVQPKSAKHRQRSREKSSGGLQK